GPMRVHADLDLFNSKCSKPLGLMFPDHYRISLHPDVELQVASVLHQFKKIAAHEDLATAECEEEYTGGSELVQDSLYFLRCHFPMIIVIEIAVDATLVAAVGDVKMHTDGNA